jgi:hypothetical protein
MPHDRIDDEDKIIHIPSGALKGPNAPLPNQSQAKLAELHNKVAGPIVESIVRPMIAAGGQGQDILLLLESVIVGTMLVSSSPSHDGAMLARLHQRAERRVADARAKMKADAVLNAAFPLHKQARPSGGATNGGQ